MSTDSSKKTGTIQAVISEGGSKKEGLRRFAQELVAEVSEMDPSGGGELLDIFISELVLSAADQRRKSQRRQRQMECIAAAKARGVRFGRQPLPLPEAFDTCRQAWRNGELSLRQAAESCGMGKSAFQRAVLRTEQAAEYPN